jgi:hypothetical protein
VIAGYDAPMTNTRNTLLQPFRFLASASLMFFALPWLMVLLILGTVAQRYIGLYASQKLFFGSFVLWVGIMPLPGAYSTLALIAGSLVAKLLLKPEINIRRSGTLLVHASAVVLLLGGLVSALAREEGYVVLADGQSARSVSDYRLRELAVLKNDATLAVLPVGKLRAGETLAGDDLPFTVRLVRYCYPCGGMKREKVTDDLRGAAQKIDLAGVPPLADESRNLTGAVLDVHGAGGSQDGVYVFYEAFAAPPVITIGKDRYTLAVRAAQRPLPFSIRLRHFTRSDYPGTDEVRAYRSDVTVGDGGLEWNTAIEMNRPLRYKGYTLYQSSFVVDGDKTMSVLAVVKNAGAWFPYIAITMLCAGLLLHIFIMLREKWPA